MKKLVLALVMFAAVVSAYSQPQIEFDKKTHDFGKVREEGGKITARFTFKNTGDSDLILTKVKPGCGCTAANYTKEAVAPGQTGFIDATYDPWGRPGAFNKNIKVSTNIPGEATPMIIFIKGEVLKRPPTKYELAGYKSGRGEVRLKEATFSFEVLNTGTHLDTLTLRNFYEDGRDIEINPELPSYIRERYRSFGPTLPAGQEGYIVLEYDGAARGAWGPQKDRAVLVTNDTLDQRKYIYYNVRIKEDFSRMTEKDLAKAPKAVYDHVTFKFDTIAQNTTASDVVKLTNEGKTPLIIRKLEASMPALTYKVSSMTIEPGQTAEITLTFKSQSRRNKQQCTLEVITNSPTNPVQIIHVSGFVAQ